MGAKLVIKLVRSAIGHAEKQKLTLRTLGLRRLGKTVVHDDTPQIRGMLRRVRHLVRVVEAKKEETAMGGER